MRDVDKRTSVGRRVFLRGAATAPAAAAMVAAGVTITAECAWAQDAKVLAPRSMATLVRMARDIYPHDHIADVFYIRAVGPWDAKAGADGATKALIDNGVALLDETAKAKFATGYLETPWEEQRVVVLQAVESSTFFRKVQGDLVVSLYNQHDIWQKFGYEGSSAEHGGYLNRGFADIDWLPQV